MNNFDLMLEKINKLKRLDEKPVDTKDDDFYSFGEDYGISISRKLYDRAIGVGMKHDEIAKLAKAKGKALEDGIKKKEQDEKNARDDATYRKWADKQNKKDEREAKKMEGNDAAAKKVRKTCEDASKDFIADRRHDYMIDLKKENPGQSEKDLMKKAEASAQQDLDGGAAVDMADSMLYDAKFLKLCQQAWPGRSKEELKYIIADYF